MSNEKKKRDRKCAREIETVNRRKTLLLFSGKHFPGQRVHDCAEPTRTSLK